MKNITYFTLLLFFTQCVQREINPEMERFMQQFEGKNKTEISEEIARSINFYQFSEDSPLHQITEHQKNVAKIDEKYIEGYHIDTTMVPYAVKQFTHMGFTQRFENDQTLIAFNKKDMRRWTAVSLPKRIKQQYKGQTIYYKELPVSHDGFQYLINFYEGTAWGQKAIIDSIKVNYSLNYPAAVDSIFLSKAEAIVTYQGKSIELVEVKDNFVHLQLPKDLLVHCEIMAFNAEGRPLLQLASLTTDHGLEKQKQAQLEMIEFLEKARDRLNENSIATPAEFEQHLKANLTDQAIFESTKYSHKQFVFRGNVARVGLYFVGRNHNKTVAFMARRTNEFGDVISMQNKEGTVFMTKALDTLFMVDSLRLEPLGERYFYTGNKYFHLNLAANKLSELNAEKVIEVRNGLALIQPKNQLGYRILTPDNEAIKSKTVTHFHDVSDQFTAVQVRGGQYYLVDQAGKMTPLPSVKSISILQEGRIAVERSDGKYGYFNAEGKLVIPYRYDFAMDFSEGLAAVRQDGNYGFIDVNGKLVLPIKYNRVTNFISGHAFVATLDSLYLIDKLGKAKVKTKRSSWGVSGAGINRIYQLGDRYYNTHAEQVPKNIY